MVWQWPVWLYLWLAGMAGGAYFAAFLVDRFSGGVQKTLLKTATFVAVPLAVLGVMLLLFELGQPLRFWHLFVSFLPASPMSMGSWILLLFTGICVIMLILWWFKVAEALISLLSWINVILAALLMGYTGVLLASSSQPLWAGTVLLPSLFLVSAVSTGLAAVIVVAAFGGIRGIAGETITRLSEADAVVILIELAVIVVYAIWLGASTTAGAFEALKLITWGTLAVPFWGGVVLLALLIPLWLELKAWGKEARAIAVISSLCVVVGGAILRAVIVIGGQI